MGTLRIPNTKRRSARPRPALLSVVRVVRTSPRIVAAPASWALSPRHRARYPAQIRAKFRSLRRPRPRVECATARAERAYLAAAEWPRRLRARLLCLRFLLRPAAQGARPVHSFARPSAAPFGAHRESAKLRCLLRREPAENRRAAPRRARVSRPAPNNQPLP